jgi:heptosyltransferase I
MLSAVGDAVHVLPVINALERHDPTVHITWILQPGAAALVQGHPAVDDVIVLDRRKGRRAFLDVRRELASRRFDVTLALQDYFKAGVLTALTHAPVRLGYDRARARDLNWLFTNQRIPAAPPAHIQDEYLEFLTPLGVASEPIEWNLGPWDAEREWQRQLVSRFDRPIASLVIGSSRREKDWIAERWAAVANALYADFGLQPVLVGGRSPREVETEQAILAHASPHPVSLLDSGLRRLVSILDASALVISLDTGPLHMAVALQRPVISLIGFSNPLRTGPSRASQELIVSSYGPTTSAGRLVTARHPDRMPRITVGDVLEKVEVWRDREEGRQRTGNGEQEGKGKR